MIAILEQKRGLNYRKHTLYKDKVIVEIRNARKVEKYEIKIDTLGDSLHYQADNIIWGKFLLFISILTPVILTVVQIVRNDIDLKNLAINYVCWFGLALVNILKQHQDDIFLLGGGKSLVFYRNIPSEKKVTSFINLIIEANKVYLKSKYLTEKTSFFDGQYMANLTRLKEKNIISEEEFQSLKRQYEIKWYN